MPWQDDLLDASIGGAPFFALSVRGQYGRRTVITEFPDRDEPGHEDKGRLARVWEIEGVVLGAEYMAARDAVVDVLESPGPHVFRHPWYGEASVVLQQGAPVTVTETATEGGVARMTFTVVESGGEADIRITPSPAADLATAVVTVTEQAAADFEEGLDFTDVAVLDAISGAIATVAGEMSAIARKTRAALGAAEDLTFALADLDEAKDDLAATPAALMSDVAGLATSLAELVRTANADDLAEFPGGDKRVRVDIALQSAEDLTAIEVETEPAFEGAPIDEDAREAERLFRLCFRATAIAQFAGLFEDLPLESTDTGEQVKLVLGLVIEALLLDELASDDLYDALADLRAALAAQVASASEDLPSAGTYKVAGTTPALLVAYWVHGDPGRDLEIVARNALPDPNFIVGEIEVLLG